MKDLLYKKNVKFILFMLVPALGIFSLDFLEALSYFKFGKSERGFLESLGPLTIISLYYLGGLLAASIIFSIGVRDKELIFIWKKAGIKLGGCLVIPLFTVIYFGIGSFFGLELTDLGGLAFIMIHTMAIIWFFTSIGVWLHYGIVSSKTKHANKSVTNNLKK